MEQEARYVLGAVELEKILFHRRRRGLWFGLALTTTSLAVGILTSIFLLPPATKRDFILLVVIACSLSAVFPVGWVKWYLERQAIKDITKQIRSRGVKRDFYP